MSLHRRSHGGWGEVGVLHHIGKIISYTGKKLEKQDEKEKIRISKGKNQEKNNVKLIKLNKICLISLKFHDCV